MRWKLPSGAGQAVVARVAVLTAGLLAAGPAPFATARADDRALFTADELAAIERHAGADIRPPADPSNRFAGDPRAAALGQFLFFDRRLSAHRRFSCASCHQPERAFADGRPVARALAVGTRNTPTLLNAADNHWFFWDGRADSMWAQVLQVIENAREFGGDRVALAHTICDAPDLRRAYEGTFGTLPPLSNMVRFPARARPTASPGSPALRAWNRMSDQDRDAVNRIFSNVGKAIAAYERRLLSRDAPFDRYAAALRTGDAAGQARLSPAAKRGLKLFVGRGGCELCHSGPDFTDGEFHNIGLPVLPGAKPDLGREDGIRQLAADPFNASGRYSDQRDGAIAKRLSFLPTPETMRGAFKTPTLRNVARTAPYSHDGRFATLAQVVGFYARGKVIGGGRHVGRREATLDLVPHFTEFEIADLVAFLNTLNSARLPSALAARPARPWRIRAAR